MVLPTTIAILRVWQASKKRENSLLYFRYIPSRKLQCSDLIFGYQRAPTRAIHDIFLFRQLIAGLAMSCYCIQSI